MSDTGSTPALDDNPRVDSPVRRENRDLVDTFELFKTYFDHRLGDLKSELVQEQDNISKKLKEDVSIKFKHEGNKIQHQFNEEIITELHKLHKFVPHSENQVTHVILNLIEKVKGRNKLIRIADTSAGGIGWTTVREYESSIIASDSEDEKKIRQAESRALRTIKDKTRTKNHPYKSSSRPVPNIPAQTAPNPYYANMYKRQDFPPFRTSTGRREPSSWDLCHACKQFGHWRRDCPKLRQHGNNNISNQK